MEMCNTRLSYMLKAEDGLEMGGGASELYYFYVVEKKSERIN